MKNSADLPPTPRFLQRLYDC